jgi:hypothetical protein
VPGGVQKLSIKPYIQLHGRSPVVRSSGIKWLVRTVGVEPTHPRGHRNLNPARLPVPPRPQRERFRAHDNIRAVVALPAQICVFEDSRSIRGAGCTGCRRNECSLLFQPNAAELHQARDRLTTTASGKLDGGGQAGGEA